MSGATATPSGLATVCSATAWASHESTPRLEHSSTTEWPRERLSGATRSAWHDAVRLSAVWGPRVFLCRDDRPWAESAKDAAQKLNQSASPSNPGRASPQEMFTNKKGPFRVLPFLQEGFMSVTPQNKLADRAIRVVFPNGGDNHAPCTVKAINATTERACYTNSVVWTTSPSEGGEQGGAASPPATAAPPTQQSISFEVVPPSPPAPAATAAPPAAARASPLPSPAPQACRNCRSTAATLIERRPQPGAPFLRGEGCAAFRLGYPQRHRKRAGDAGRIGAWRAGGWGRAARVTWGTPR